MDVVVKIGGRLGHGDRLVPLCARVAELGGHHRLLVVPGGGVFAAAVRECDARLRLRASTAHWMAVLAMDQYGHLLSDLIPRSVAVPTLAAAEDVAAAGRVPVLLPYDLMRRLDILPHSWLVTSDSIAAWVTGLIAAPLLVLLKERFGLHSPAAGRAAPLRGAVTLDQLAAWEGVDDHLATIAGAADYDLWVLDGEEPAHLVELLEKGSTDGVSLTRAGL